MSRYKQFYKRLIRTFLLREASFRGGIELTELSRSLKFTNGILLSRNIELRDCLALNVKRAREWRRRRGLLQNCLPLVCHKNCAARKFAERRDGREWVSARVSLRFSRPFITLKPIASESPRCVASPSLSLIFVSEKLLLGGTERASKGFHIGRAWKYRPHVPRTREALSPLSRNSTHVALADGRSCFISKSFSSRCAGAKVVDINNFNVSLRAKWYFPPIRLCVSAFSF